MEYLLGALAVYKTIHLLELAVPPVMPWVKVVSATVLGYGVSLILQTPHLFVDGLIIATVASGVHSLLRFATLAGDLVMRKAIR